METKTADHYQTGGTVGKEKKIRLYLRDNDYFLITMKEKLKIQETQRSPNEKYKEKYERHIKVKKG